MQVPEQPGWVHGRLLPRVCLSHHVMRPELRLALWEGVRVEAPTSAFSLQLIQTISVVDRDEPQSGHRFYFTLVPEATNNRHFSLLDVQGESSWLSSPSCDPEPARREGARATTPFRAASYGRGWALGLLPCPRHGSGWGRSSRAAIAPGSCRLHLAPPTWGRMLGSMAKQPCCPSVLPGEQASLQPGTDVSHAQRRH